MAQLYEFLQQNYGEFRILSDDEKIRVVSELTSNPDKLYTFLSDDPEFRALSPEQRLKVVSKFIPTNATPADKEQYFQQVENTLFQQPTNPIQQQQQLQSSQVLSDAELLQDFLQQRGKEDQFTQPLQQILNERRQEEHLQRIKEEDSKGLEEPWIDPTFATSGFLAGSAKAGAKALTRLPIAIAGEYAAGGATEYSLEKLNKQDLPDGAKTALSIFTPLAFGVITGKYFEDKLGDVLTKTDKSAIKRLIDAAKKGNQKSFLNIFNRITKSKNISEELKDELKLLALPEGTGLPSEGAIPTEELNAILKGNVYRKALPDYSNFGEIVEEGWRRDLPVKAKPSIAMPENTPELNKILFGGSKRLSLPEGTGKPPVGIIPMGGEIYKGRVNQLGGGLIELTSEAVKAPEIVNFNIGVTPEEAAKAYTSIEDFFSNKIKGALKALEERFPNIKKFKILDELPSLSAKDKDDYLNALYGKLRPTQAQGAMRAKEAEKKLQSILKNKSQNPETEELLIKYFENPEFRNEFKTTNPDIANELDPLVKTVDDLSEKLYQMGEITQSQREKWKGRYLARMYAMNKLTGVATKSEARAIPLKGGRKYDSIMDIAKEDREALGYIQDVVGSAKLTIARNYHNIAANNFYRELIKNNNIVNPEFIVKNPFKINELPEFVSPYYAQKKLIPYLAEEARKGNISVEELKQFSKTVKEKVNMLDSLTEAELNQRGLRRLTGKKEMQYSILSGMPINKDVALQIEGIYKLTNEPEAFVHTFDKVLSGVYGAFKTIKVPFNLRAYPRNFISNVFQFAIEGHNPIGYLRNMPDTVKDILNKDKYFTEALEMGLTGHNFSQQEIVEVLSKLNTNNTNKFLKKLGELTKKAATPYGWIDDFAKLNTYSYFRKKGKSPLEAVKLAHQIHYDYSFVPYWTNVVRSPDIKSGTALKLLLAPFITFSTKSAQQVFRGLTNQPITTTFMLSAPFVVKSYIENYYKKRNGKQYDIGEKYRPEYLKNPLTVHTMTPDGEHIYFDLTNILPFGWILKGIAGLISGDFSGLTDIGFGGSPLNALYEALAGRDIFTGKDLYTELDSQGDKILKGAEHIVKKLFMPPTINQIQGQLQSEHPALPRWLAGVNTYKYDNQQLINKEAYKQYKLKGAYISEIKKLIRDFSKGKISQQKLNKEVETLNRKYLKRLQGE